MAFVFGTSTNYQTFADAIHNVATGSSLSALVINAAGTGYAVGDTVNVNGGTSSIQGQAEIMSIGGGGSVTGVRTKNAGLYTVNPGTGATTTAVTGVGTGLTLNTTIASNGWTSRRSTNVGGAGEREVIIEGSGSGTDSIIVGYRSFFDSGSGARNLCVNGFTGFNSGLAYENQPGRSPGLDTSSSGADFGGAYVLLTNSTITWWISVTSRRIIAVAKTGTCYSSCHMGFLNPFATGGEWPYPLFVCGTCSDRFRLPSSTVISSSGIVDPVRQLSSHVGPGLVRSPSGSWDSVFNSTDGSPRSNNGTGVVVTPGGLLNGVSMLTGDNWFSLTGGDNFTNFIPQAGNPGTQAIRLLPTEDGANDQYIRIPATLTWSSGVTPGGVYGEIDGAFWFEANATVVAENRLTNATDRFLVFQSGVRSDNWALWCLKES